MPVSLRILTSFLTFFIGILGLLEFAAKKPTYLKHIIATKIGPRSYTRRRRCYKCVKESIDTAWLLAALF
jgi:hypothetical protein